MTRVRVRWQVTEEHETVIEIDDYDPEDGPDEDLLAEHEDNQSYQSTPDRQLLEYEEVT